MSDALIEAHGLGKMYRRRSMGGISLPRLGRRPRGDEPPDEFWALKDIDLELREGESLGIIGPNGAGKSTLLKILSRVTKPTSGRLTVRGRVGALIEVGAGFHPELSGRDNIFINGAILGMSRREIQRRFDEIVAFAELEDFIDTPVKKYSSGMYVRLGFAVAANMDPDLLLVDEVLAVGDARFQKKCFDTIARFKECGTPLALVSHSMYNIERSCDRALLLIRGEAHLVGPVCDVIGGYQELVASQSLEEVATQRLVDHMSGTGDVIITEVELLDATGQQRTEFDTRDSLLVRVQYQLRTSCKRFNLRLVVLDGAGEVLAVNDTYLDDAPIAVEAECGRVECHLEGLPLTQGTYGLRIALFDETSRIRYDTWDGNRRTDLAFSIRPNRKSAAFEEWRGILELDCTWDSAPPSMEAVPHRATGFESAAVPRVASSSGTAGKSQA